MAGKKSDKCKQEKNAKWVTICGTHINTDQIATIESEYDLEWDSIMLTIVFDGENDISLEDPDRKLYRSLCKIIGIDPVESIDEEDT